MYYVHVKSDNGKSEENSRVTCEKILMLNYMIFITFHRPQEVGQLHKKFGMDYHSVLSKIITSSIRNLAGSSLTVDNFRFNRTYVEVQLHNMLRRRLGGETPLHLIFLKTI